VHCVTNDVPIPVPEPSRWLMLFAGVLGLGAIRRLPLAARPSARLLAPTGSTTD
jgi:hypothetical protein